MAQSIERVVFSFLFLAYVTQKFQVFASPCSKPADVVFVLDASNSIWRPDFVRQLDFVEEVISFFTVSEEKMRIGALTFGDQPRLQFHMNQYYDQEAMAKALRRVRQEGGLSTHTADAIKFMREESFRQSNGARDNVTQIGIVITDGLSYNREKTAEEAKKAREDGIHMFAIGVGRKYDMNELYAISGPGNQYVFMVQDYQGLDGIKNLLAIKACTVTDPPPTDRRTPVFLTPTALPPFRLEETTRQVAAFGYNGGDVYACAMTQRPTDLVFVVDSKAKGADTDRRALKLVKDVIQDFEDLDGNLRIGIVHQCTDIPGFSLASHTNKTELLDRLTSMQSKPSRTAEMLKEMSDKLQNDGPLTNQIEPVKKVGVYISDAESNDMKSTLGEAQNAKLLYQVEIFGVAVGKEMDKTEMKAMVSCGIEDHYFMMKTDDDGDDRRDNMMMIGDDPTAHGVAESLRAELCKFDHTHY